MVRVIMGQKGSGKTKRLLDAINAAVAEDQGSVVCIENGQALRYDVNYRVRLVDSSEYPQGGYAFLKGFVSGLHAGNFDITHIFIDNLYKVSGQRDVAQTEDFLVWCDAFSKNNGVSFTFTISDDPSSIPAAVNYL